MRGKRRLHKRPNIYEIERCKIWLDNERQLVKPSAIIAMGVTAARSVTVKTLTISKQRSRPLDLADGKTLRHDSSLFAAAHRGREGQARSLSAVCRRSQNRCG
jgi:uracil-DNA glycosylase family 4